MIDPSIRLRRAIHLGDEVLVQRIVATMGGDRDAIRNADYADESNTSLHAAARLGHLGVVKQLVAAGHEDERISVNNLGWTPLRAAVEAGQEDVAVELATRFPRCIPWTDKPHGMDALMGAARKGCAGLITAFLSLSEDYRALLTASDRDGNVALHFASAFGHLKCVMLLLQAGAPPHAENNLSWQPVHYSSTVSAEVFFKNAVLEMEKRRSDDNEVKKELERRKDAGVRVVVDDHDGLAAYDPSPPQMPEAAPTGRTTPSSGGGRSQSRGLVNRLRAGSLE